MGTTELLARLVAAAKDGGIDGAQAAQAPADIAALFVTQGWLYVLAAPQVFRSLQHPVDPAFLTRLLDIWIAYVDRGDGYMGTGHAAAPPA